MTLTRRTPLRRTGGLARTGGPDRKSRLNAMSPRREARQQDRRDAVATAAARDQHQCQAQFVWPHRCWGPLVGHEPLKRSQGGDPCDPDQVLMVCAGVNGLVEDEPEWARSVGLAVHSWETWSYERDWGIG